jgi:hypothetical protein
LIAELAPESTETNTAARGLSNRDVLRVWEIAQSQDPINRALTMLAMTFPEEAPEALSALPIGQRDELLFAIREATFGSRIEGLASCPDCGEAVELTLNTETLCVEGDPGNEFPGSLTEVGSSRLGNERSQPKVGFNRLPRVSPGIDSRAGSMTTTLASDLYPASTFHLNVDGWEILYRLPDSGDLASALTGTDAETALRNIANRCITSVHRHGQRLPLSALDDEILEPLAAEMSHHDPNAEIELVVNCPSCQNEWKLRFDIASFLWIEIEAMAKRLLREVASLAHAYRWREADILALSPARRQAYLDLM